MKLPILFLTLATAASYAANFGTDTADDPAYDAPGGWQSGDNGGTPGAFGAWTLTNQGANSGHFIGDSTTLAPGNTGADINSTGESFGMFGHSGQTSEAFRDFNGMTLSVGQSFSIDLAVNFRNGNKGFDLRDSSNAVLFNLNVGSNDYIVSLAATGNGSIGNTYDPKTKFTLTFLQTSLLNGTWTIVRAGGVSDNDTGTYSGAAHNIKLYNSQTTGGGAASDNLYANNLKIVPEPSAAALLGAAALSLGGLRRRRA